MILQEVDVRRGLRLVVGQPSRLGNFHSQYGVLRGLGGVNVSYTEGHDRRTR